MSDYLVSLIRTYVPIGVGILVTWLSLHGLKLSEQDALGLSSSLTGAVAALYYLVVRALEHKWPKLGVLLGVSKLPNYTK